MAQYNNIHRPDVSFVWTITDVVLRDTFKKSEIGDVILPFVVLRRMDCILGPYNKSVRARYEQFKDKIALEKLDPLLRKTAGGLKFYNTSKAPDPCTDPAVGTTVRVADVFDAVHGRSV